MKIAVVGLGFGAEFIPIYQNHPNCGEVAICTRNPNTLKKIGDMFNIDKRDRYTDFNDVLKQKDIDAIHIVTPIPLHAEQSIAALDAGKHTACTVPMATSMKDIQRIIEARKKSGKEYFMMETTVYSREYLYVKQLLDSGEFGSLSFLRGAHYQNMEGWPGYWHGFPPMYYATHAVSPLLAIADARPVKIHCFGSGRVRSDLKKPYMNPYRFETAIISLSKDDLGAEVSRFLFQTSRQYMESFNVYAEKMSFEWQQANHEKPLLFKGEDVIRVDHIPDRADLLPESIQKFTTHGVYGEDNVHLSFIQGSGHGGSHPHMVHEFVMSIVEKRKPYIDDITSAYWTSVGLCAHESAMNGGEEIIIPEYDSMR